MTVTGPTFIALPVRDVERAAEFVAPWDSPFGRTFTFTDLDGT